MVNYLFLNNFYNGSFKLFLTERNLFLHPVNYLLFILSAAATLFTARAIDSKEDHEDVKLEKHKAWLQKELVKYEKAQRFEICANIRDRIAEIDEFLKDFQSGTPSNE